MEWKRKEKEVPAIHEQQIWKLFFLQTQREKRKPAVMAGTGIHQPPVSWSAAVKEDLAGGSLERY